MSDESFRTAEDEIDFILGQDDGSSPDTVDRLFHVGGGALGVLEDDDKSAASDDSFSRTLDSIPGISRMVSQSPPQDALGDLGGTSPDRVDLLFDINNAHGGLEDVKAAAERTLDAGPGAPFPVDDLNDYIGVDCEWTIPDEALEKLMCSVDNMPSNYKTQKYRLGCRVHNFQTCKRTIKGVEHQGAAAIHKARFASGTAPVQGFWADATTSALEEIKKKKQDTWTGKPDCVKSWTEERRQKLREYWTAQQGTKKEEWKRKKQASLASTFERKALVIQRTIDERLGAAGVLSRCGKGPPSPDPMRAATLNEAPIAPAPKPTPVLAEGCRLCMKFAPNIVRNCPGRDGEVNCVYFQSDGALKHTVCARCASRKGPHAQRCKGGRLGEGKCQFNKKNGQPRKTNKCEPPLKRAFTC